MEIISIWFYLIGLCLTFFFLFYINRKTQLYLIIFLIPFQIYLNILSLSFAVCYILINLSFLHFLFFDKTNLLDKLRQINFSIILLLFLFAMVMSSTNAFSYTEILIKIFHLANFIMLYILTINYIEKIYDIKRVQKTIIISGIIVGIISIFQYFSFLVIGSKYFIDMFSKQIPDILYGLRGMQEFNKTDYWSWFRYETGSYRPTAFFLNPAENGMFALITFFLSLNKNSPKKIRWPAFIISFVTILLVQTRAIWLAFLIGLMVYSILVKKIRIILLGVFILSSVIIIGIIKQSFITSNKFLSNFIYQFYTLYELSDPSTLARLSTMKTAIYLFSKHLFFGYGLGNVENVETNFVVHSQYLAFLVETGLLGFSALLLLIGKVFIDTLYYRQISLNEEIRVLGNALISILAAFLFIGINTDPFFKTKVIPIVWVLLGLIKCPSIWKHVNKTT